MGIWDQGAVGMGSGGSGGGIRGQWGWDQGAVGMGSGAVRVGSGGSGDKIGSGDVIRGQ